MGNSTPRRASPVLWVVAGLMLLLIFGCILTAGAGLLFMRVNSSATTPQSVRVERAEPIQRPTQDVPEQPSSVTAAPSTAAADNGHVAFAAVYRQVNPSVVNINTIQSGASLGLNLPEGTDPGDFFSFGSGSGFVWDTQGHIVTNEHVVADADQVQVTFADGAVSIAEVIGTDVDSDLAVLRIDTEGFTLTPLLRGSMDDVYVGMPVAAIGNPFGLEGTLTTGIVSALGRSIPSRAQFNIPDSIQTDAAINPGNSGGPLLNERGELLGVNAQIRSEARSNSGVGFAVPISIVARVVPALIADGVYWHSYMGISGANFSPLCADEQGLPHELRGAVIVQVIEDTPAERAGLRSGGTAIRTEFPAFCPTRVGGDVITAIDSQPITKFDDVLVYLERYTAPGDTVTLTVLRDGENVEVPVTLAQRPENVPQ